MPIFLTWRIPNTCRCILLPHVESATLETWLGMATLAAKNLLGGIIVKEMPGKLDLKAWWGLEALSKCLSLSLVFQIHSQKVQPILKHSFIWLVYCLHVIYKYEALASKISSHSLIIFTTFKPRHLIICEPCTNLSISLNSLYNTLISIIYAKIASHSHGLSSYWTLVG